MPGEPGHASFRARTARQGSTSISCLSPLSAIRADARSALQSRSPTRPGRKIAYKAMKAGAFFVASGEEGDAKFYLRYAIGAEAACCGASSSLILGAEADALDRVALAIANAFEPYPTRAAPRRRPRRAASADASADPAGPPLVATALVVAPGQALTALTPADCAKPIVGGQAAHSYGRVDAASGLALLDGDFGAMSRPPARPRPTARTRFVLSLRARRGGRQDACSKPAEASWRRLGADAVGASSRRSRARAARRFSTGRAAWSRCSRRPAGRRAVSAACSRRAASGDRGRRAESLRAALGRRRPGRDIGAAALGAAEIARRMRAAISACSMMLSRDAPAFSCSIPASAGSPCSPKSPRRVRTRTSSMPPTTSVFPMAR